MARARRSSRPPAGLAPGVPGSRDTLVAVLVIAVTTLLAYSNSFDASFHFDDWENIVQNARLRDLSEMWPPFGNRYLGYLSFALNFVVGSEVFGFHVANTLIHAANGALVFWLAALVLRTPVLGAADTVPVVRRWLPLTAALLFTLHPVQTQAVTYVVQRFASLATLFYLVSVALFIRARLGFEAGRPSGRRTIALYCGSIVAAAAAMSTKEISFTLPLVVGACEMLLFGPRRRLLAVVPLAAAVLLVVLGLTLGGRTPGEMLQDVRPAPGDAPISSSVYLVTQFRVVATYLRLLVLPIAQNLDYDFRLSRSLADPSAILALMMLLAIVASAAWLLVRHRSANRAEGVLIFWGVAWFFVTLSIESSVIPIRDVIFEHRMYLPLAGAAVALGTALLWAGSRLTPVVSGKGVALALALTAGPLALATHARNEVWRDPVTLWSDVVSKSPGKARARYNLGRAFVEKGRIDDAIREFEEAIRIDPAHVEARHNLGSALAKRGDLEGAARAYRAALGAWRAIDPQRASRGIAETHRNLGLVLEAQGELESAAREYREAIRLDPASARARNDFAVALAGADRLDEAIRELEEAVRLQPGFGKAHENLCGLHAARSDLDLALRECTEAVRLNPAVSGGYHKLGHVLMAQGRAAEAARAFRRALESSPDPEIVIDVAGGLERAGDRNGAIAAYQVILRLAANRHIDEGLQERARSRLAALRAAP